MTAWMDDAACIGFTDEVFFPHKRDNPAHAKAICGACPVATACLEYALAERIDHGVFGGTTPSERHRMRVVT